MSICVLFIKCSYIYVLIMYFCMFKFYFQYLLASSIDFFIVESLILRLEHGVP